MGNLVYTIAIVLVILWAIGYFGFGEAVGNFIHILLVLAVIAILYRLITGRKP
jgi:vacuolar-type H+-ATPase subunit I/STV1